MRKKTFSRFLQGAVSMVMVASMLTGCGGSAASTSSSNASAETATTAADNVEYKDTLVVGEYGDSDSLDPQKNVSTLQTRRTRNEEKTCKQRPAGRKN